MSVYSGFATRQQQTKYNSLIQTLIIALKKRIIKFYNHQECDQSKFKLLVKKIYKKLFCLEKAKYLAPKFTSCFGDLIQHLRIQINYDTLSQTSSIASQSFTIKNQGDTQQQKKYLKSKNLLEHKKNEIHQALKQSRQKGYLERFSLRKNNQNTDMQNRMNLAFQQQNLKINARLKLKQLKQYKEFREIRSNSQMPKMEDFMPKVNDIIQQSKFDKTPVKHSNKQVKDYKSFRRHKFSKSDYQFQEI